MAVVILLRYRNTQNLARRACPGCYFYVLPYDAKLGRHHGIRWGDHEKKRRGKDGRAMQRKFLEGLGLEKEAVDKILDENSADIGKAKADYDTLKQERDTLMSQVAERDGQLEGLKKSAGDNEALMKQIADLQVENLAAKQQYEADMKGLKLSTAIKLAIGDSAQDVDLVTGLFDKDKLILSDDGKVTGLEEQLKALKKEKAFLFKEEKPPQTQIRGGKPAEGNGTPPAGKKPSEMTYSEMCAYLEANPGAKIE